jgi:Leucine-rich repeat (LRR) protein
MEGPECVPKTYRDFCKDSPWHVGVIALSSFFVRQDCDRGEEFLQNAKKLDFSNKNLTNLEVMSGLRNLKDLNLSGNKIQSLNSLLDTSNIEILRLNYNTTRFDVSSLGRFKNLKVLHLSSTDFIHADQLPVMDSVEELLISHMDAALLRKFPRLKKLSIHADADLDISDIPNGDLQSLTIKFANRVSGFSSLERFDKLVELDFGYIENFEDGGRIPDIPSLTSLAVYESPFPIIDELSKIETFVDLFVGGPKTSMRNAIPELQNLKNLTFESYDEVELGWLACCSNLETITLRGMFESLDTMPLLPKVRIFDGQQLELKSISGLENLPRLAFLDLTMSSPDLDFSKFPKLSNLEEFIYTTVGGQPAQKSSVAWLQKIPALRSLTLAINPVDENLGAIFPKDLRSLSLISHTIEDLSFLKTMSSLRNLGLYIKEGEIKDASSIKMQPLESLVIDVPAENLSRLPKFGKIDYLLLDTVGWDDKVTEDYVSPLGEKIPEVKEMRISGDVISLKWLEKVDKLKILKLDGPFEDLLGLPQLPLLNSLIVASTEFRSLIGIEKVINLERLEFETFNRLETLRPLSQLKSLKELVGPFMRRNFPDLEACPEDNSFPEGLRTYCRALDIPLALSYGPLPY